MSAHRATKTRVPSRASLCEATLEIIGQGLRARYELPQEVPSELRRLLSSRKSAPPQVEEVGPFCLDPTYRRRGTPNCSHDRIRRVELQPTLSSSGCKIVSNRRPPIPAAVATGAFCPYHRSMPAVRHFPPSWQINEAKACFIVRGKVLLRV